MVPIRDPGLIGRKIDCPKCKYRFVVEEPADADDDEDAKPEKKKAGDKTTTKPGKGKGAGAAASKAGPRKRGGDDDDDGPSPKKKKEGSNTLVLGGVLAAVAVIALVVCAICFWPSGDDKKGGGNTAAPAGGSAPPPGDQAKDDKKGGDADQPPALANATNLLPNDTQVVVAYPVGATLGSSLSTAALDSEGGFRKARFQQTMGFGVHEIHRVVSGMNANGKDGWVFTVVQTRAPFDQKAVKAGLRLDGQTKVESKAKKNYDMFLVRGEFDPLGNMLIKLNQPRDNFAVHFYDANTMVFADQDVLRKFLEQDAKPEYLTKEASAPAGGEAGGGGAPAGGMAGGPPPGGMAGGPPPGGMVGAPPPGGMAGGPPPGGMVGAPPPGGMVGAPPPGGMAGGPPPGGMAGGPPPGGMVGGPPPGGMVGGPPPGGMVGAPPGGMPGGGAQGGTTPQPEATIPASWMTVEPAMKAVLDRIEKLEENKTTKRKEPASVVTIAAQGKLLTDTLGKMVEQALAEHTEGNPAQRLALRLLVRNELRKVESLGASIQVFDQRDAAVAVAAALRSPDDAKRLATLVQPYTAIARGAIQQELALNVTAPPAPAAGGNLGMVGGGPLGGPPPGALMVGGPPPGGIMGKLGGPPPGGIMGGPPPGGIMGGPPPGGIMGGPPPGGIMGGPPPGGIMGGMPFPGGMLGGAGGGGGAPAAESDGTFGVTADDRVLIAALELKLSEKAYETFMVYARLATLSLKGQAELATNRSRIHELARALSQHVQEKGGFPRGTVDRPMAADRGLPWRPDQRLSWVVELLPFLGEEYADWRIDRNQSWDDQSNESVAYRVIGPLLAHRIPGLAEPRIPYPGKHGIVWASTHFTGMAGLGMEAADYRSGDTATANKRGIFGYDRVTTKAEVKDGLDKTIALIMVPGEHKAPWLAGGGATVRAVSDDPEDNKPIAPFVCCTFPGKADDPATAKFVGKRGTIAIMGDGKVRWIPEDLPAATFRALCTIAGGEKIDRLDSLCPVIEAEEGPALRTDGPALPGDGGGGPAAPPTGGTSDRDRLQGSWLPTSIEVGGAKLPPLAFQGARLTFRGDTLTAMIGKQVEQETVALDPSKRPKHIDMTPTEGPNKGKKQFGIYELNGDELKVCAAEPGSATRPTSFSSPAGSKHQYMVLRRDDGKAPVVNAKVEWKDYTPPSKAFTVRFPGEVAETKQEGSAGPLGKVTAYAYLSRYGATEGALGVTVTDLPLAGKMPNAEQAFAATGQLLIRQFGTGARITNERSIKLGAHPGRDYTISIPGKGTVRVRIYLAGNQQVLLQAGPMPAIPEAEVTAFLDSFKLGR